LGEFAIIAEFIGEIGVGLRIARVLQIGGIVVGTIARVVGRESRGLIIVTGFRGRLLEWLLLVCGVAGMAIITRVIVARRIRFLQGILHANFFFTFPVLLIDGLRKILHAI